MAEHRENDRHIPPEAIPIRDHFRPVINNHYSGIARGAINANNFELKPALINMVKQNQFAGTATSDPHVHLRTFLEITDTVKINNVPDDIIRMRLFPFSLKDQARGWLQSLPLGSITTWEELATKFLSERSGVKRTAGVYAVDPITSLTAQVSALTTQIASLNKVSTSNTEGPSFVVEESQSPEEVQYINNKNFGGYRVGTFVAESGKRMARTESRLDNLETHMASIGATLKILESQVGQITKQLTSQPSDAIQKIADPNLREVNAIFIQHKEIGVVGREEKEVYPTPVRDENPTPTKRTRGKRSERYDLNQCIDISLLPYPQRFLQLKAEFQKKKGLEDLKNLDSNIQSVEQEDVAFTEENDKGRQGGLPRKLQDPGEFVVPCEIGGQLVEKAICDSGASVNIMPSSLYEKLGLSMIEPTGLTLQMADKSVRTPLGIVEDVELKIDKIRLLADFVVLDMGNSQNVRTIFRRPFLATAGAIIDLRQGKLTLEVDSKNVELRASTKSYDPP
ncbi:uncharacterized protein [Primulina eburnea]|uniref:uncharacterized protein n=1 Tax=Primulina eburnea TaxID=1245227 RepID=UPI003C6BE201